MKIRNGFVSNSSSSSFILDGTKWNCVDVAKDAIETLRCKGSWEERTLDDWIEKLEKLPNKDTAILIEMSDNLEIYKENDKVYVEATHHIDWNFDAIGHGGEGEYVKGFQKQKIYFPQYDMIGKLATNEKGLYPFMWIYKCDKCESRPFYFEMDDGTIYCPICKTDPNGKKVKKLFRYEKLKRIVNEKFIIK